MGIRSRFFIVFDASVPGVDRRYLPIIGHFVIRCRVVSIADRNVVVAVSAGWSRVDTHVQVGGEAIGGELGNGAFHAEATSRLVHLPRHWLLRVEEFFQELLFDLVLDAENSLFSIYFFCYISDSPFLILNHLLSLFFIQQLNFPLLPHLQLMQQLFLFVSGFSLHCLFYLG